MEFVCGYRIVLKDQVEDGKHRHRGNNEGASERWAHPEDEDRVYFGSFISVGGDAGEAAEGRHECCSL